MEVPTATKTGWFLLVLALGGCDGGMSTDPVPQPDPPPEARFGALTANISGEPWISSYFNDSVVANYVTELRRIQITGQKVGAGSWPTPHVFAVVEPGPGRYAIGGTFNESVWGEWHTPPDPARARLGGFIGYLSNGYATDSLFIDEWDVPTGVIRGRFRFEATELHGTRGVWIIGTFAGRVMTPF